MTDAGASLLEVNVGQRAAWKSPEHPFRKDSKIKLTGVPTVLGWSAAGPTARLGGELEAAASPAEAVAVVSRWLAAQKK